MSLTQPRIELNGDGDKYPTFLKRQAERRKAKYIVTKLAGAALAGAATYLGYRGYQHYKRIKISAREMRDKLFIIDGAVSRIIFYIDKKNYKAARRELKAIQPLIKTLRIHNNRFIINLKVKDE